MGILEMLTQAGQRSWCLNVSRLATGTGWGLGGGVVVVEGRAGRCGGKLICNLKEEAAFCG